MPTENRPAWVADAVFYQVFPDRFARSDRVPKPGNLEPWGSPPTLYGYKGGDLLGVAERLDWITDLGATAIYLNPIFRAAANHRYHTHDYFVVDPMLGGDAAFRELLDSCHARGIRVVLDGVFNHTGRGFYQFNDILENGSGSAWIDWYTVDDLPLNAYCTGEDPNFAAWWGNPALPKLNTENPAVREYLMTVAEHWTRRGIDGWRLDVPEEISTEGFWEEMRARVRAIEPEAYLVGEIWGGARDWIGDATRFDGVMNYPMTEAILRFAAGDRIDTAVVEPVNLVLSPPLDAVGYRNAVESHLDRYPWDAHLANLNLLGSHDTARVRSMVGEDDASLRLAAVLQMTFPGAPSVYYGDEVGATGGHDPGCRAGFPWDGGRDEAMLEVFRSLIALRHRESALRRGVYRTVGAQGGLYAFTRIAAEGGVLVAVNAGNGVAEVETGVDTAERLWGEGDAGYGRVRMRGRSAGVWRVER